MINLALEQKLRTVGAAARSTLAAVILFALGSAASAQVSAALSQKAPDAAEIAGIAHDKGYVRVICNSNRRWRRAPSRPTPRRLRP